MGNPPNTSSLRVGKRSVWLNANLFEMWNDLADPQLSGNETPIAQNIVT